MNILIIEDNRDIAENIADYLEPLGHTLDFAADGLGGLHLAITKTYDVIVLDLMLPGNGWHYPLSENYARRARSIHRC